MEQQRGKKDNGGYLFRNAKKSSDKQPDYRGKVNVNGKEMLISGWIRQQDGEEMISISLTDPATLPPKTGGAPGGAPANNGPFARQGGAPAQGAAPARPAAAPTPSPKDEGYSDLEDLDGLFNGLDD